MPFEDRLVDLALSRRLERTEGLANRSIVESRLKIFPDSRAAWTEVAGTLAQFDGLDSPLSQTFGLGLAGQPAPSDWEKLEDFFQSRQAPVHHEVSPLAPQELAGVLNERGYRPMEFTNVMCRSLVDFSHSSTNASPTWSSRSHSSIEVRRINKSECQSWSEASALGWEGTPEITEFIRKLGRIVAEAEGAIPMQAEIDGKCIATGMLFILDGVALLGGASTLPSARGQGAQAALLSARLQFAKELGCDLAMMCAYPGSSSQRNAQRNSFQICYTRIKWILNRE